MTFQYIIIKRCIERSTCLVLSLALSRTKMLMPNAKDQITTMLWKSSIEQLSLASKLTFIVGIVSKETGAASVGN